MSEQKKGMTQRGYDRLVEKLEYLKTTRREEISAKMGQAIADGDLRESAAYDEARLEQSANEADIANLELQLERAEIREADASGGADLGAVVRVRDEAGKERSFELVGTFEADVRSGKISDNSPFGLALMGKKAGETVEFARPDGKKTRFEVLEVSYP